jgi:hypothetical protein
MPTAPTSLDLRPRLESVPSAPRILGSSTPQLLRVEPGPMGTVRSVLLLHWSKPGADFGFLLLASARAMKQR